MRFCVLLEKKKYFFAAASTSPRLNIVVGSRGHRVNDKLRMAGMDKDTSSKIAVKFVQQVQPPLQ